MNVAFEVALDEPTTGARWRSRFTGLPVLLQGETLTPSGTGGRGASATRVFTIVALEAGALELRFELARAWDPHASITHIEHLDVAPAAVG
jgi:predicted secreted protein